jgi:hypothetical protein
MNVIDPQRDFQTLTGEFANEIRKQAPQPWFRAACNSALAQVAWAGATADEINGARKFMRVLMNIGEVPVPLPAFPRKDLDETDPTAPRNLS